jgi:hypothetical protein
LTELKINKKQRNKIRGNGYKHAKEWVDAKTKRIIFIYIFAALPEIAGVIGGVYEFTRTHSIVDLFATMVIVCVSFALVPWCIAIIYHKHLRYNSTVTYEMYNTEQLLYGEDEFTFAFKDFGEGATLWTYHVRYSEIEELIDYPNVSMIQINGKFGAEGMNGNRTEIYNRDRDKIDKICVGYYYEEFDTFKRKLEEKTGLQFITEEF